MMRSGRAAPKALEQGRWIGGGQPVMSAGDKSEEAVPMHGHQQ
jgi:hypothetical protein